MKYFIVEGEYLVPFDRIKASVPAHGAWLQQGFAAGRFLLSGPLDPPVGGVVIARAESMADLQDLFEADPFSIEKLSKYTFREFLPVLQHGSVEDWFKDFIMLPMPDAQ